MSTELWMQLLSRGVKVQFQEIATNHHALLVVRQLGVRQASRDSIFGPIGPFTKTNDQFVPVSAFLPLGQIVFTHDGTITTEDKLKLPSDPSDFAIEIKPNAELQREALVAGIGVIRTAIQALCDQYDVRTNGVIHIIGMRPNSFGNQRTIIASTLFVGNPRERLTLSISEKCKGIIDSADFYLNGEKQGAIKAGGKALSVLVSRGKNDIYVMSNGEKSPHVLVDALKDATYVIAPSADDQEHPLVQAFAIDKPHPSCYALPEGAQKHYTNAFTAFAKALLCEPSKDSPLKHVGKVNAYGRKVERTADSNGSQYTLKGKDHDEFVRITDDFATRKEFNGEISADQVRTITFDWLIAKAVDPNRLDLVDYTLKRLHSSVILRKVSLPLDLLDIDSDVWIGHVHFHKFDSQMYELMYQQAEAMDLTKRVVAKHHVDRVKEAWKDKVFATVEVWGDESQAIDTATEMVEQAMMLLRYYSPHALDPELPCDFDFEGRTFRRHTKAVLFAGSPTPAKEVSNLHHNVDVTFVVTKDLRQLMQKAGLSRASMLIKQTAFNELESLVLRCIATFVHGMKAVDRQDRLVFIIAAAETLLSDTDSPLLETVSMRLGYLCADTASQRRDIRSLLRDAQRLRGRYLHHSSDKHSMEVLRSLQMYVWTAINNVIKLSENLKKPSDLYHLIEQSVLS